MFQINTSFWQMLFNAGDIGIMNIVRISTIFILEFVTYRMHTFNFEICPEKDGENILILQ